MNHAVKDAQLRAILGEIAPDADVEGLAPDADIREELDIDSMDFLNFVIAVNKRLGVEVPEIDYPKLGTLAGCVRYLDGKRT